MDWTSQQEVCIHCRQGDWQDEFGPRTLIICACCQDLGTHVECEKKVNGKAVEAEHLWTNNDWFCSKECQHAAQVQASTTGRRLPVAGGSNYTSELVKWSQGCKASQSAVEAALKIFRGSFDPMVMANGKDLITMVCTSLETSNEDAEAGDEAYDFGNFRVMVLRKGATVVSAATVRLFGTKLAEVPFVATREGYRHEGNCRRLMTAVEALLRAARVRYLVVPSVKALLPMWTRAFECTPLTLAECQALEDRIVMPDHESALLVKKAVYTDPQLMPPPPPRRPRGRPPAGATARRPPPQPARKRQRISSAGEPASNVLRLPAATAKARGAGQCGAAKRAAEPITPAKSGMKLQRAAAAVQLARLKQEVQLADTLAGVVLEHVKAADREAHALVRTQRLEITRLQAEKDALAEQLCAAQQQLADLEHFMQQLVFAASAQQPQAAAPQPPLPPSLPQPASQRQAQTAVSNCKRLPSVQPQQPMLTAAEEQAQPSSLQLSPPLLGGPLQQRPPSAAPLCPSPASLQPRLQPLPMAALRPQHDTTGSQEVPTQSAAHSEQQVAVHTSRDQAQTQCLHTAGRAPTDAAPPAQSPAQTHEAAGRTQPVRLAPDFTPALPVAVPASLTSRLADDGAAAASLPLLHSCKHMSLGAPLPRELTLPQADAEAGGGGGGKTGAGGGTAGAAEVAALGRELAEAAACLGQLRGSCSPGAPSAAFAESIQALLCGLSAKACQVQQQLQQQSSSRVRQHGPDIAAPAPHSLLQLGSLPAVAPLHASQELLSIQPPGAVATGVTAACPAALSLADGHCGGFESGGMVQLADVMCQAASAAALQPTQYASPPQQPASTDNASTDDICKSAAFTAAASKARDPQRGNPTGLVASEQLRDIFENLVPDTIAGAGACTSSCTGRAGGARDAASVAEETVEGEVRCSSQEVTEQQVQAALAGAAQFSWPVHPV